MSGVTSILNILRFRRRNWKAVVLCVFAATVFWFLNALNKTYTANISFPLYFDYDNRNFVPVKSLPEAVRLNVTGNGWDLFKRSTGFKVPSLEIPLERPSDVKRIVGSTLPQFFSSQLEGLQINYVLTDTLYIDLEPKLEKYVQLMMDSAVHTKNGYGLVSAISIKPDSILISGPRRIINTFHDTVKLRLRKRNIDEDYMEDVIIEMQDAIKRDPASVSVSFKVSQMITVKDSIRLVLTNIPSTVSSVMNTGKIPVTLQVPQNIKNRIVYDSLKAILDLSNFRKGSIKLLPRVEGLPPYSKVIHIDSIRVKL